MAVTANEVLTVLYIAISMVIAVTAARRPCQVYERLTEIYCASSEDGRTRGASNF